MALNLPESRSLLLEQQGHALHVTLNRPRARNAMNLTMVHELMNVFDAIADNREIRAVVLRGAEGNFCAGGDIKDMLSAVEASQSSGESGEDPFYQLNRAFGHMITRANRTPQVVIAVLEGAVLGGGFGLACVSDIAIAGPNAQFGLPETGLGIPPAQIAPFVVKRIGLTQARRLALTGARFGADEARQLGLVHFSEASDQALQQQLDRQLELVKRCAPEANAVTKALMLDVGLVEHEALLDGAAEQFSAAVQGSEGQEGTLAFVEKRDPHWAQ